MSERLVSPVSNSVVAAVLLFLVFGMSSVAARASTRFVILPVQDDLSGWMVTEEDDNGCLPSQPQGATTFRIGREESPCGIARTFLSFDFSVLTGMQLAGAEMVFYQGTPESGAYPEGGSVKLDLIQLGKSLDADDWEAQPSSTLTVSSVPVDEPAEFRVDVVQWISYVQEALQGTQLQVRVSMTGEGTAAGIVMLEGMAAEAGLEPRLEIRLAEQVVAPLRLTGSGPGSVPIGLPAVDPLADSFLGLALMNPNTTANRIFAEFRSHDGLLQAEEDLGNVGKRGQVARVLAPEHGADYLTARGNWGVFQGFFIAGDNQLMKQDGIGGGLPKAEKLFLPLARIDPWAGSRVFLFRSTSTADASPVEISMRDADGTVVNTNTVPMSPIGSAVVDLQGLFPAVQAPEAAYLQLESEGAFQAFELIADSETLVAVGGSVPEPARRLFAPHFFVGRTGGSRLHLVNAGATPVTAAIEIYTDSDDPGTTPVLKEYLLPAEGLLVVDLAEALEIDPQELAEDFFVQGHFALELTSSDPSVLPRTVGLLTFGQQGLYETALPLSAVGLTTTYVLHVAQSDQLGIFTGLAVLNPGTEATDVTVQAYSRSGALRGTSNFTLGGRSRRVDVLKGDGLFGEGFEQVDGHLAIVADRPVVVFAIFGGMNLEYYSAIEGQPSLVYPRFYREERGTTGSCTPDSPGPVLIWGDPDPRLGRIRIDQGAATLRLKFWDGSVEASPLGGVRRGIDSAEWSLETLETAGATATSVLTSTGNPHAALGVLNLTIPPEAAGPHTVIVVVTDVNGCSSQVAFDLLVE